MRRQIGECPVEGADRRAGGADNDDVVLHPKLLLRSVARRRRLFGAAASSGRPGSRVNNGHLRICRENWRFLTVPQGLPQLRARPAAPPQNGGPAQAETGYARHWAGETREHHGRRKRADHNQEIRQPAALQHRHQHLRHARRPRRHGQERRGFRRLRRQDRRGHHPLGAGADHLRAGEQGRPEPAADRLPAAADPLLRRQHADAGAALSSNSRCDRFTSQQDKFREQMAQAFGVGGFGPLEDQVRRNMEMFEKTFAMFAPFARGQGKPAADKPAARAAARWTSSSASSTRCRSGGSAARWTSSSGKSDRDADSGWISSRRGQALSAGRLAVADEPRPLVAGEPDQRALQIIAAPVRRAASRPPRPAPIRRRS